MGLHHSAPCSMQQCMRQVSPRASPAERAWKPPHAALLSGCGALHLLLLSLGTAASQRQPQAAVHQTAACCSGAAACPMCYLCIYGTSPWAGRTSRRAGKATSREIDLLGMSAGKAWGGRFWWGSLEELCKVRAWGVWWARKGCAAVAHKHRCPALLMLVCGWHVWVA